MRISEIWLKTHRLEAVRAFYADTLALPEVSGGVGAAVAFRAGESVLIFEADESGAEPYYHFAFNIPQNQLAEAKSWLAARTPLLTHGDKDEIEWTAWNAQAIYFRDPAGNIGELIARYNLRNASQAPFGPESLLRVSEIGLMTDDVVATAKTLQDNLQIDVFDAGDGERFRALGDDDGLFIIVKRGHMWFPTDDQPAAPFALQMTLESGQKAQYTLPGLPYLIETL